jgi:hypothetical protein
MKRQLGGMALMQAKIRAGFLGGRLTPAVFACAASAIKFAAKAVERLPETTPRRQTTAPDRSRARSVEPPRDKACSKAAEVFKPRPSAGRQFRAAGLAPLGGAQSANICHRPPALKGWTAMDALRLLRPAASSDPRFQPV